MPVFFNDAPDDPLTYDGCDTFTGGQHSFARARLIQPTQASRITNHIIQFDGELRSRHGIKTLGGDGTIGTATAAVQALIYYDRVASDKLVGFSQGNAFEFNTGTSTWSAYFTAGLSDTTSAIDLVQLTENLYWSHDTAGLRKWNGAAVSTIASTTTIPPTILEVHTNRLVLSGVAAIPDAVYFGDILADTFDTVNGQVRLGGGDGDPVVALKSWLETGVLVFKRNSVYLINANPLSSVANFSIKRVHRTLGCVARRTVCQVGQDVWFLSRGGVQSVQRQFATSDTQVTVPVSQPVQDVIQKIRWDQVHKSHAVCYNNFYMLAIPVDSNDPDTILVYHYLTQGWTIFNSWSSWCFLEQPNSGGTRLLVGQTSGDVKEWRDYISENQDVAGDFVDSTATAVQSEVTTRALIFSDPISYKSPFYCELDIYTQDVTFSVYAILDDKDPVLVRNYTVALDQVELPTTLPFTLTAIGVWTTKRFPLVNYNTQKWLPPFRELQLKIVSTSGRFVMRRLVASAFLDTVELKEVA